jgi:hypothetical protein
MNITTCTAILLSFSLLFSITQAADAAEPPTLSPADRKVLLETRNFREVHKKGDLPAAILNLCTDGGGAMAEPGQPFQVTDVIRDATLPGRRLIWGAIGGDYYVVHYEIGGYAHVFDYLVATMPKGGTRPTVLWHESGIVQSKNFAAFATALREHRFERR